MSDSPESIFQGEMWNKPLAPLTSWHIGGAAERFYMPATLDDLALYLHYLPHTTTTTWLGLGSNVLVPDEGVEGAVICTRQLQALSQQMDNAISVQAGVTCAKFARFCSKLDYPDAAFFAGIPGTIGGALAMNAGAFGGQTWDWVKEVKTINRQGEQFTRQPSEYEIGYRSVKLKNAVKNSDKNSDSSMEFFVGAIFNFPKITGSDGMRKIRELLRARAQSQPIGTLNCGSVYQNPPDDFAARLIEACQLKGYQIGGAMISPKHANFIINTKNASAFEVIALMKVIETSVQEKFGIVLKPEVRILS